MCKKLALQANQHIYRSEGSDKFFRKATANTFVLSKTETDLYRED